MQMSELTPGIGPIPHDQFTFLTQIKPNFSTLEDTLITHSNRLITLITHSILSGYPATNPSCYPSFPFTTLLVARW